jgi:hypothetical protein
MGIERLSKSQVSVTAKPLDRIVASFRNRPFDPAGQCSLPSESFTVRLARHMER